jgi:hypothetical protein
MNDGDPCNLAGQINSIYTLKLFRPFSVRLSHSDTGFMLGQNFVIPKKLHKCWCTDFSLCCSDLFLA